jgi:hypothetical protein
VLREEAVVTVSALRALNDPFWVSLVCWGFVAAYYGVSWGFISASRREESGRGCWRQNGLLDIVTSSVWVTTTILLIASLLDLASRNKLSFWYLAQYYLLFIFLFGFIYGILQWHWPGMLKEADQTNLWTAEAQYLTVSMQTITTLGYTGVRPGQLLTEWIACVQAMIGIVFVAIFIGRWVNTT